VLPNLRLPQLNRAADHEGYCLAADWLNSARLLNWVRDLQICINRFGISVVGWAMPIPGGVPKLY
jgi:hypothetical protein